jgi:hypothetical protein
MTDQITLKNNGFMLSFDYDPEKVAMLKSMIPYTDRKWVAGQRVWMVDTRHSETLRKIFPDAVIPQTDAKKTVEERTLTLKYLGNTKDRGDGDRSAMGFWEGGWNVVFAESILRQWFEGVDLTNPSGATTFYGTLGVMRGATKDEIKNGYRRLAKQWHPDVCSELNAKEVFLKIKQAYETLSDEGKKARYDVGLLLTKPSDETKLSSAYGYRSPFRCGFVTCTGMMVIDKFVVTKILKWDDITNDQGQSLVTSWVMGEDKPREKWV